MKNYNKNIEIITFDELEELLSIDYSNLTLQQKTLLLSSYFLALIDNVKVYGMDSDYEIFPDAFDEPDKANFIDCFNDLCDEVTHSNL